MTRNLDTSASLTAIGDSRCKAGYGIKINDVDSGLCVKFWIENDSHVFENVTYMMTLELAFKNIMVTEEDDAESNASATKRTGIIYGN